MYEFKYDIIVVSQSQLICKNFKPYINKAIRDGKYLAPPHASA